MPQKILIELTEDQINKILESRPQKPKPIEAETFSIKDTALKLGIKKTKIYQMLKDGEISKITIGKSPRICRAEIDKFLTNSEL
jgi:excisionase family DNA binding protein